MPTTDEKPTCLTDTVPLSAVLCDLAIGDVALARDEPSLTRQQAVDALRQAEAKYRGIFENAVEGIFQTTPDGHYLSANPALARIYGYDSPPALIAGIGDIQRQLYVDHARRDQFIDLMNSQQQVVNFESAINRRDGSQTWISENARVVRDSDGRIDYYEGTVVDISERKQSEALLHEKETAEAANRAKSQFLAHMSHELRTPLNGVIGMLDLLEQTPATGEQRRFLEVARSSADLLLNVINQILDFSKIEAGRLELESTEFNLRALVEETLEILAPRAQQKGLELTLDMPPELSDDVNGDRHRLLQVIVNLVGNAIKFTAQGQVQVRVCCVSRSSERVVICVAVEDTGIGIASDRMDRLFRSFSQVDASITREFGGTGLGLAISKELVQLMGGSVGVESQSGRGSSFWFRVPLLLATAPAVKRGAVRRRLQGLRILAVDDNRTNREMLLKHLSAWGCHVETTHDATSALGFMRRAAADGNRFDIALVDYGMPHVNGLELACQIRQDDSLSATPIVMLTPFNSALTDAERQVLNIAACLTKPLRQAPLFDAIRHVSSLATAPANMRAVGIPPAARQLPTLNGSTTSAQPARLLLAEDNEINRLVAVEILRMYDLTCDIATTGQEAVERLLARPYEAVLMDCQMPLMDGLTATREIRRLEANGALRQRGYRVPIIAVTANTIAGDREACLAAGMDQYLTKPIDAPELIQALQTYLGPLSTAVPIRSQPVTKVVDAMIPNDQGDAVEPPIQLDHLIHRCLDNLDLVERVIAKLADRLPVDLEKLEQALAAGNLNAGAELSHTIKGAAANLSATQLKAVAGELETACETANGGEVQECMTRVRHEVRRSLDFIAERKVK